jgi:HAD superfamily hydrolase (TIGR01490 family)
MTDSITDSPSAEAAKPGAVAFFDMDGTLVRGQTPVLLVRFMRKAGSVSLVFLLGVGLWFVAYKIGVVKPTRRARERAARVFKGRSVEQVEAAMTRFAREVLVPRFDPRVVGALREHTAKGDRVVILSAALEPVVKALGRELGVEDYVGAACEISKGRYSGRIDGPIPHANEKTRVAARFISRAGVLAKDCWAYGDHDTDLPLLRWVGHPVAVNPRPGLLAAAQRAVWPILA